SITLDGLSTTGTFTNTNATYDSVILFTGLTSPNNDIRLGDGTVIGFDFVNATVTLTPGQSMQMLDLTGTSADACRDLVTTFAQYAVLIGLVGTVFFIGIILLLLTGFATKNDPLKRAAIFAGFLTIVSIAVLIVIAIVIFNSICGLL
ncbi:MAG: hypothetical protein ACTSQA_01465, partial [Candidatus Heimdallarchaeaceae archaeon]